MNDHLNDDSSELTLLRKRVAELESSEAEFRVSNAYLKQLYEEAPLAY